MGQVRLIMTWDIQDDKERSCVEFMVNQFGPGLLRLGLRIIDAWYTVVGTGPQIMVIGMMESDWAARDLLNTADFRRLREQLLEYVENFSCRIRPAQHGGL